MDSSQKAEGDAAHVFVGVLKVVAEGVAEEDHFAEQSAFAVHLGDQLDKEEDEFFEQLVSLIGHDKADNGHEEGRAHAVRPLARREERQGSLHGLNAGALAACLERAANLGDLGEALGLAPTQDEGAGAVGSGAANTRNGHHGGERD